MNGKKNKNNDILITKSEETKMLEAELIILPNTEIMIGFINGMINGGMSEKTGYMKLDIQENKC